MRKHFYYCIEITKLNLTITFICVAHSFLCRDILQTASDVIWSLPQMSLADETKIPSLGASSLLEVSKFLKHVVMRETCTDIESKLL